MAFGGRAMPASRQAGAKESPKYINSPDTPIYEKSRHLYGLFEGLSVLRKARRMIILASEDIGNADPYAVTLATSWIVASIFVRPGALFSAR